MARPVRWSPPVVLSAAEEQVAKRMKRTGKFYLFVRRHRHELFDDAFRTELESMYAAAPRGTPPKDPMFLWLVTLLQAYTGASDADAVENAMFDRRWQMILDCWGTESPPFSQGVLVDFRQRVIAHDMDRRLVERTVELARETGAFGYKALRVALDSAPLEGAGRVEDTFNLIAHAMEVVLDCAAIVAQMTSDEVGHAAGVGLLGEASIKAALDIDWSDDGARSDALTRLLADVDALRRWIGSHLPQGEEDPPLQRALDLLAKVIEQDLEPDPDQPGRSRIRGGVAKDRVISIHDPEMKHGRKSKNRTINGFKKHLAVDLDSGLILAATARPANHAEHAAELDLRGDVERLGNVVELHADRGYLAGQWLRDLHASGQPAISKAWARRGERFAKGDFDFDFDEQLVTCPAGETASIRERPSGRAARFRSAACRPCALRDKCLPSSSKGTRDIKLHAAEELLQDLRGMSKTSEGRVKQRERVAVEHRLAHHCRRQGPRARYVGTRKNTFDCRRIAAVENLHVCDRLAA